MSVAWIDSTGPTRATVKIWLKASSPFPSSMPSVQTSPTLPCSVSFSFVLTWRCFVYWLSLLFVMRCGTLCSSFTQHRDHSKRGDFFKSLMNTAQDSLTQMLAYKHTHTCIHSTQALHRGVMFLITSPWPSPGVLRQRTTDHDVKKYCVEYMKKIGSFEYTRTVLADLEKQ